VGGFLTHGSVASGPRHQRAEVIGNICYFPLACSAGLLVRTSGSVSKCTWQSSHGVGAPRNRKGWIDGVGVRPAEEADIVIKAGGCGASPRGDKGAANVNGASRRL
jgi:hypothetical protein